VLIEWAKNVNSNDVETAFAGGQSDGAPCTNRLRIFKLLCPLFTVKVQLGRIMDLRFTGICYLPDRAMFFPQSQQIPRSQ
jgi:hypothetical protein